MTPFDPSNPGSRPRRFSSNGPEAAFLRHETVIGIHTPRRRSSAASDSLPFLRPLAQINASSGKASSVDVPAPGSESTDTAIEAQKKKQKKVKHATDDRISKKKDKKPSKSHTSKTKTKTQDSPRPNKPGPHGRLDLDDAARPSLRRLRSNLEEAAAAAAASTEPSPVIDEGEEALDDAVGLQASLSDAALEGKGPLSAQDLQFLLPPDRIPSPRSPLVRVGSPRAPPLRLAKRLLPQNVEGTLYDKTGPYREGAVTDGLSVRLFSAETDPRTSSFEDADLSNSEHPVTKPWGRRGSSSSYDGTDDDAVFVKTARRRSNSSGGDPRRRSPSPTFNGGPDAPSDSAVDDSSQIYLITTPDNRVSSAAKLRRWAMDSNGAFYAAMEIKSIEAKLRAADPSAGRVTRELAKELEETYLDDILDEVQKAQTLNPARAGIVSKILKTEDGRYVRLEEDYPEEAFFVIAGCEEAELTGVILNVFNQAIRTLARFHASGWMHGDIKLENLMFDERGELVVIDYENANPYRGIPGGDGQVQLVSYDWVPPEACPGPMGRRMGPSGDLWALGCNLIRAFALRDGVEDVLIRESLLGKGQRSFLEKMARLVVRKRDAHVPADDYFAPQSVSKSDRTAYDIFAYAVDLEPILNDNLGEEDETSKPSPMSTAASECSSTDDSSCSDAAAFVTPDSSTAPSSGRASPKTADGMNLPSPTRLLYRFARSAPELLTWVLSRCVVESTHQRSVAEAEVEGVALAEWFEQERADMLDKGRTAVDAAIEMSGSVWVKPRLDDARKSMGLE
uniref:Protein kinase n=2 Tax=Kalmanozyma brasiliensis (strain GHG001) TaxID=1365824 RepID=V5EVF5_KALBG